MPKGAGDMRGKRGKCRRRLLLLLFSHLTVHQTSPAPATITPRSKGPQPNAVSVSPDSSFSQTSLFLSTNLPLDLDSGAWDPLGPSPLPGPLLGPGPLPLPRPRSQASFPLLVHVGPRVPSFLPWGDLTQVPRRQGLSAFSGSLFPFLTLRGSPRPLSFLKWSVESGSSS